MVLPPGYYNTSQTHVGHRYIYYRVYSEDGGIAPKKPSDTDDSFLARIQSSSVSPPHTAASLKSCFCKLEDIKDTASVDLFVSRSSQSALDDSVSVAITTSPGPGYKAKDPMALVIRSTGSDPVGSLGDAAESSSDAKTAMIAWVRKRRVSLRAIPKPKYIYYRVYKESAIPATEPFKKSDPTLARINVDSIPPPHTAASLKRCMCKVERVEDYTLTKLFEPSSESPLDDETHLPILSGGFATNSQNHMVLAIPA